MSTFKEQTIFLVKAIEPRLVATSLLAILTIAVLEVFGVGVLAPYIAVLSEPESINTNKYLKYFSEFISYKNPNEFILKLGFIICFFTVFKNLTTLLAKSINYNIAFQAQERLTTKLFNAYVSKPYIDYTLLDSSLLMKNLTSLTSSLVYGILQPLMSITTDSLILSLIFIMLLGINVKIALAVLLFGTVIILGFFIFFKRFMSDLGKQKDSSIGESFKITALTFRGIKEVKASNKEDYFSELFRKNYQKIVKLDTQYQTFTQIAPLFIETVGILAIIVLINVLLSTNTRTEVLLIAGMYAIAAQRILPILARFPGNLHSIKFYSFAMDQIFAEFNKIKPHLLTSSFNKNLPVIDFTNNIKLDSVSFTYPNSSKFQINNISLNIRKGEKIGITGPSGAGKTTIVDIVLGLLNPTTGKVIVDDTIEINERNTANFRNNIGYISQSPFLFDDTIANNIIFGDKKIDFPRLELAIRQSLLGNFIDSLPHGIDSPIGEQGVRLSGGQRQRIAIARALYQNKKILIMDEATSSLDNITEKEITDTIHTLGRDVTILIIAHRLNTIKLCDRIIFMESGEIRAEGTFNDLSQNSLLFTQMFAHTENKLK